MTGLWYGEPGESGCQHGLVGVETHDLYAGLANPLQELERIMAVAGEAAENFAQVGG